MLRWAIIFAILSLVLGLVGFGGMASAFAAIAKLLFFLTIAIFVVLLALGLMAGKSVGGPVD